MINISRVVEEIVGNSEFAIEGLNNGCLNMSAYAKSILPDIEAKAKKPVRAGSIVAALSRMVADGKVQAHRMPKVVVHNIVSRSGLAEITYIKSPQNQALISELYNDSRFINSQFFVVTVGLTEISIITTEKLAEEIRLLFGTQQPKLFLKNLASLSMQTPESGIETPNQFYAIVRKLAPKNINVVEFITTYTELSFILDERDLKQAFNILHDAFIRIEV
jgi:aspartokinase